jgi:hypothetical protein
MCGTSGGRHDYDETPVESGSYQEVAQQRGTANARPRDTVRSLAFSNVRDRPNRCPMATSHGQRVRSSHLAPRSWRGTLHRNRKRVLIRYRPRRAVALVSLSGDELTDHERVIIEPCGRSLRLLATRRRVDSSSSGWIRGSRCLASQERRSETIMIDQSETTSATCDHQGTWERPPPG